MDRMLKELSNFIKSPLNYTGNKYRILSQITQYFPSDINCMVDLFCGGATVGLNTKAKKVVFVDSNERVIDLLIFLSKQSFDKFLINCEKLILRYHLSNSYENGYQTYRQECNSQKDNNGLKDYNSLGYYSLRDDYNSMTDKSSDKANLMLYILMVYAFNNDIRFNSDGNFNLPIGKTDLNRMNVEKIKQYIERVSSIESEFVCLNFNDPKLKKIADRADFVYMDPPYLIGNAVYNNIWDNEKEYQLLDFIDYLMGKKINFALSNVIAKVGRTNEPLSYWCHKNEAHIEVKHIDYHYRSASYNKLARNAQEQEVLVINKEYL